MSHDAAKDYRILTIQLNFCVYKKNVYLEFPCEYYKSVFYK